MTQVDDLTTKPGNAFRTTTGRAVPAISANQMREVDRIATDVFGLGLLQMMEHAGRNLAGIALDRIDSCFRRNDEWAGMTNGQE
jgi:hypothetical protein